MTIYMAEILAKVALPCPVDIYSQRRTSANIAILWLWWFNMIYRYWHPSDLCLWESTASKVHVADIEKGGNPTSTPGPSHDDRVNPACHDEGKDSIAGALHTLRHSSAHNGSASCAEGPLKEPWQHDALASGTVAGGKRCDDTGCCIHRVEAKSGEASRSLKHIQRLKNNFKSIAKMTF